MDVIEGDKSSVLLVEEKTKRLTKVNWSMQVVKTSQVML